jgi:nucleotide-binding universal stress UspA family protein
LAALLISKFLAAFVAQKLFRFRRLEMLTMWGMSIPQVATTLAAALVGHQAGLLTDAVLNAVVVMMLVTAILGPHIVRQTARSLPVPETELPAETAEAGPETPDRPFTIVVPVYNPRTEQYLIELAALIAEYRKGVIKPLAIANAQSQMDSPRMNRIFQQRETLLVNATKIGQALNVAVAPLLRIDNSVAEGISRTAREQKANLVIMGWSERHTFTARLFGTLIDSVLWSTHCPLAISYLRMSPRKMTRCLVPIKQFTAAEAHKVQIALAIAQHSGARITLLHVTPRQPSVNREMALHKSMRALAGEVSPNIELQVRVQCQVDTAKAILQEAQFCDLVVMRTYRRRSSTGDISISDISNQVAHQLNCSLILLGEPRSNWLHQASQ